MADITPDIPPGRQVIESYGGGAFRIAGTRHHGSVLVFPGQTLPWPVRAIGDVTAALLAPVVEKMPAIELLILGCGTRFVPLGSAARAILRENRIALELMDTGAACRTFNVLLSEDRAVAAALLAVE